jgi:hypothetical protein
MLEEAAAGAVFCALHGEAGNDLPLMLAVASATRADGGWEISGHKIFGSLSPVWTYGGLHAMDTSDPANPQIVHGFVARDTNGVQIIDTWDTLGMRATQSQDTVLDKAFVPRRPCRVGVPCGFCRCRVVPALDLRVGAAWIRGNVPRSRTEGVRHHGRDDAQAVINRFDELDGTPP